MLVELTVMMLGRMERMSQDAPKRGQPLMRDRSPRVGTGLELTLTFRPLARQRKTEKKGEEDEKR